MLRRPYYKGIINNLIAELTKMSVDGNGVCVRILEKDFRIACPKNQEKALREAAQYLDKQMRHIRQTGRVIGIDRIAVMAALNITNELLTLKNAAFEPDEAFSARLKMIQEKIDVVLNQKPQRETELKRNANSKVEEIA